MGAAYGIGKQAEGLGPEDYMNVNCQFHVNSLALLPLGGSKNLHCSPARNDILMRGTIQVSMGRENSSEGQKTVRNKSSAMKEAITASG